VPGKKKDFARAYDIFRQIQGRAHDAQHEVWTTSHIASCEAGLIALSSQAWQKANDFYAAGALDEASLELTKVRDLAPRTEAGGSLLQGADELGRKIEWECMCSGVNRSFTEAQAALTRSDFKAAVAGFVKCQTEYAQYAEFLSQLELVYKKQIPILLAQANRGVALENNVQLQNKINAMLPALKEALAARASIESTSILEDIFALNDKITCTDDVLELGYMPKDKVIASIADLQAWVQGYNWRRLNEPAAFAQRVYTALGVLLSKRGQVLLMDLLTQQATARWLLLDGRDLEPMVAGLVKIIIDHLKLNNCLANCIYNADFYIANENSLNAAFNFYSWDKVLKDQLKPIQIALFALQDPSLPERVLSSEEMERDDQVKQMPPRAKATPS
jgi:hypothetical protein